MKILEPQSAVLSNFEVAAHISALRAKPRSTTHGNVETILKEASDYLSPSPPDPTAPTSITIGPTSRSLPNYISPDYSHEKVAELIQRLKPYTVFSENDKGLYKNEMLMILNLRPRNAELLDTIVEECDERFTTEEQSEILSIVGDVLGGDKGVDEANGVEN